MKMTMVYHLTMYKGIPFYPIHKLVWHSGLNLYLNVLKLKNISSKK